MRKALIFFLLCAPAFATFTFSTNWEVRTTGSDSNGGGFDIATAGTDYSQQDSSQVTYTDMVIDGTTNTKFTSTGFPCSSTYVGNIINVTSGTGFTVQRVQVVSCSSTTYNVDKSLGTLSSTAGHAVLGGGLATIGQSLLIYALQNKIWVKSGTYTKTSSISADTTPGNVFLAGYQTTHGDNGTKPLITTATNSVTLINNTGGTNLMSFTNMSFSNTAGTRGVGFGAGGSQLNLINSTLDGFSVGIDGDNGTFGIFGSVYLSGTEIKNCTSHGLLNWQNNWVQDSWIHANAGDGIQTNSSSLGTTSVIRSIISSNARGVVNNGTSGKVYVLSSDIVLNTGDGIASGNLSIAAIFENNIIYGNGGWGIDVTSALPALARNNAYGSNASGNYQAASGSVGSVLGPGDATLTVNPFVSSTNFAPNSTAGGGSVVSQAGYPGAFPGGASTGYLDIGAVQGKGSGQVGYASVQ